MIAEDDEEVEIDYPDVPPGVLLVIPMCKPCNKAVVEVINGVNQKLCKACAARERRIKAMAGRIYTGEDTRGQAARRGRSVSMSVRRRVDREGPK